MFLSIAPLIADKAAGKKGTAGNKAKEADPELDALLAELEDPTPAAAAPAASDKKGKKKKGKGGEAKANNDEDIDALLAAIDGPKAAAPAAATTAAGPSAAEPQAGQPSTSANAAAEVRKFVGCLPR